ncbi:MAG: hypothetical protein AAGD96_16895 [Chloroflexota bacterium]
MNKQTRKNNSQYFLGLLLFAFTLIALTAFSFESSPAQAQSSQDIAEPASQDSDTLSATVAMTTPANALYFPFMHGAPFAEPTSLTASRPLAVGDGSNNYTWQLTWDASTEAEDVSYVIYESQSPDMEPLTSVNSSPTNSFNVTRPATTSNIYYYAVKVDDAKADESDPIRVVNAYRDDFDSPTTWEIRRQDFDDTNNVQSYQADNFKMHVRGRWDYFISSPLAEAPAPPYRISTLVKFDGPGNLNAYGLIFGGDWNGGACPSVFPPANDRSFADGVEYDVLPPIGVRAPDAPTVTDNCLNRYYRLHLLWKDGGSKMLAQLKKIDFHDDNNEGRGGSAYIDGAEFRVSSGNANTWNEWSLEVYPDGTVLTFAGDERINSVQIDPVYLNQPYFGTFAASNEYPGADPLYHYFLVEPIEPLSQ